MWPFRRRTTRQRLDERVRAYVREQLPERLGVSASHAAEASLARFNTDLQGRLRAVRIRGLEPLVLRLYRREARCHWLAGYADLYGLLHAGGVPLPRLLFADVSPETLATYGFSILAEELVEGRVYIELTDQEKDELLPAAVALLHRMHDVRSPSAGRPWLAERWDPGTWAASAFLRDLRRLRRGGLGLPRSRESRLADWFGHQVGALKRSSFPFVHTDLDKVNLILADDGRLRPVDFLRGVHWFPQADLYVTELVLGRDDPARTAEALDAYFHANTGTPALTRERYGDTRALFAAPYHVVKAASRARRAARQRAAGDERWPATLAAARQEWMMAEGFLSQAGAPTYA